MRRALLALVAAAALAACGDGNEPRAIAPAPTVPDPAERRAERSRLQRARCPADAPPGCRTATGRVLYVEAVDPDGDGDAHYVLAGGSITAPGLSVIDVAKRLRPRRLPRPGDRVSAAGPVYRGSFGQRQIEALVVNYEER